MILFGGILALMPIMTLQNAKKLAFRRPCAAEKPPLGR
jgi:hypothetical protein